MASIDQTSGDGKLAFDVIRETDLADTIPDHKRQRQDTDILLCDVCLNNTVCTNGSIALYMCYECETYLCVSCFRGHEGHGCMSYISDDRTRTEGIQTIVCSLQSEIDPYEEFHKEHTTVCNRINVKHELDKTDCWITGLCGVDETRWFVCDCFNFCIKMFNTGSKKIKRYIRLGSKPYDITAFQHDKIFTKMGKLSADKGSDTERKFALAVTFPGQRVIMLIDIETVPATKLKVIKTESKYHSIDYMDETLFALCEETPHPDISDFSVHMISLNGDILRTFNTDISRVVMYPPPYLSLVPELIYITNWSDHTVQCFNTHGQRVSKIVIEGSWPYGITCDESHNMFICAGRDITLYKVTPDLKVDTPLIHRNSIYMEFPRDMCLFRDKLYVSHFLGSPLGNFVTVIRIL